MKFLFTVTIFSALVVIQGCAHGEVEKRLDEKLAGESQVKTSVDISKEAKESIERAPGLSQEQRVKLLALRDTARSQMDALTNQSLRLRSVLIKDIIATGYAEDEVQLIKKKIREVEDKRVAALFDVVDQANRILGRLLESSPRVLNNFFFESPHGHFD